MIGKIKTIISVWFTFILICSVITTIMPSKGVWAKEINMEKESIAESDKLGEEPPKESETATEQSGEQNEETAAETESITSNNNLDETPTIVESTHLENTENSETQSEEETAEQDNHYDPVSGLCVVSDNIPEHVKLVVEICDVEPLQEALNIYYKKMWEAEYGYDEDINDEADYDYDEYSDDTYVEDYDYEIYEDYDSDVDNEYREDYEAIDEADYGYRTGGDTGDQVVDSYKISFYDTLENKEYILPEGEMVKLRLKVKEEYQFDDIYIIRMQEDNSIAFVDSELETETNFVMPENGEAVTEKNSMVLEKDKLQAEKNSVVLPDNEAETNPENSEESVEEDENAGYYETKTTGVTFDAMPDTEYGVVVSWKCIKTADAEKQSNVTICPPAIISPQTGYSIWFAVAVTLAGGILTIVSLICYRKRDKDIV